MVKKICIGIIATAFIAAPMSALAHERKVFNIGGTDYLFVVGSLAEPVVVDDKTGLDLRIKIADPKAIGDSNAPGAKPVEGLEKTLKVELIAADKKKILDITPAYKDPGAYKNTFFPTVATTLTYRVFGTINEKPVDLSFTCSPAGHVAGPDETAEVPVSEGVVRKLKAGKFGCPIAKEELGFPEPTLTMVGMHEDSERHMTEAMAPKKDDGSTSAALAFGIFGVALGALALWKSGRKI